MTNHDGACRRLFLGKVQELRRKATHKFAIEFL